MYAASLRNNQPRRNGKFSLLILKVMAYESREEKDAVSLWEKRIESIRDMSGGRMKQSHQKLY